jgi:hypothetical protein
VADRNKQDHEFYFDSTIPESVKKKTLEDREQHPDRKDGKVFKEFDDLLSATRYAIMDLRFARTLEGFNSFNRREINYPRGYGYY